MRSPDRPLAAADLLVRPRLLRRFDAFERGVRVVGLWAPVGSGKSALLRQWADALDAPVHMADAEDESQVMNTVARLGVGAAGREHLVVDRMERATPRARDAIMSVIDTASPAVRVALAGRFDPLPASPARWALTEEIRADELAFTADEAGCFFDGLASPLTEEQLARLLDRTGGWATALVLLRQLLDGRDDDAVIERFNGDSRLVAEYLVSELLSRLSPAAREVLLWSAIGDAVPVELAAVVTGHADAGSILDELARTNSLLTRDAGDAYVLHPILGAFLAAEQQRRDLPRARRGHERAAAWFTDEGDLSNAVEQLALSGDREALAAFLEQHGRDLIFRGASGPTMRAVRQLAAADRERLEADLRLLLDIPYFTDREGAAHRLRVRSAAQPGAVATPVDEIVDALWAHANGDPDAASLLQRETLKVAASSSRATALLLKYAQAWTDVADDRLRTCEELIHLGAPTASTADLRWLRLLALEGALAVIATASVWVDAERVFLAVDRELRSDADITDSVSARAVFAHAAQAFHRGDPLPTTTLRRLGSADAAALDPAMQHIARTILALDGLDRKPGPAALGALTDVIDGDLADRPVSLAYAVVPWITSAMRHGDTALADRILFRCGRVLGPGSIESFTAAFVRRPDRTTEQALRQALADGAPRFSPLALSDAWVALAVRADQRGRDSVATESIVNALMCAAPLGAVRPFLREDQAPAAVLRSRIERLGAWRPLADVVLEHADATSPDGRGGLISAPLSPRERELIRELPAHQSIKEIAARRQVSVNTVKSQLRSLYGKLGATSRKEAVASARQLGLL